MKGILSFLRKTALPVDYFDYDILKIQEYNRNILDLAAINLGIASASHEVILTLDADVYFESDYLKSLTTLLLDSDCVILPVRLIAPKNNVVQHLDALEFKSLQLATFGMAGIGLPILANGANFLFKKTGFNI